LVALRHTSFSAGLPASSRGVRRARTLGLLAIAVATVAFAAGIRDADTTWIHVATPHFLSNALGRPLPDVKLVRHPGAGTTLRMGGSSFGISHGEVSFGLAAAGVGGAPWRTYAHGVGRPVPFGLETVTAGRTKVEQFLTVGRHVGPTTWRWKFVGLPANLTPRVGADGYVAFLVGTGAVKRLSQAAFIAPPAILNANGHRIPERNLHWSVSSAGRQWWLSLRVDDAHLPTPYVIDPIAERGTSGTGTGAGVSSLALTTPTGTVSGDVLVGHVAGDQGSADPITRPAGWTQIYANNTGAASTDISVEADYLVLSGAPAANYSWGFGTTANVAGGLSAFSGVNPVTPLSNSATPSAGNVQTTAGTTATTGAITWSKSDAVVAMFATSAHTTFSTFPASFTELYGKTAAVSSSGNTVAGGFLVEAAAQGSATSFNGTFGAAGKMVNIAVAFNSACQACTWTGTGGDNNWSTGANWSGGVAPATDGSATLTFPSGAAQLSTNNDEPAGTTFAGIVISGSGYTLAGNQVTLGASGISDTTTSGSSTISLPLTSAAVRTVSVTNAAETLTLSGIYSGAGGGITKTGSGVLTLSGANTFTGAKTLSAGTLNINNATALGTTAGTFTIQSGTTLDNTSGSSITTSNYPQAWSGDFTFTGTNSLNLGTGAVAMNASRVVTVAGSTLSVGGVISGATFSLTKAGAGALALSGTNTFTGGTILNAGTLDINSASALGTVAGTFTINGGTIDNTTAGAISTVNYPQAWNGDFTFAGTQALTLGTGAVAMNASRQVTVSASTLTVGGVISGAGFGLTKAGAGALSLSGASTYTGGATLNAGTLNVNNATALGTGTFTIAGGTVGNTTAAAITESNNNAQAWNGDFTFAGTQALNLGTGNVTMSASRQVTVSASTLTVGGAISGAGLALTKAGAGVLTLAGANTFTGGTTLNAGTLNVNNATALGTGTFTIAGGTVGNSTAGAITESNNNAQAWNGDFTFAGTQALNLGTGAVTMSASRSVTVSASTLTVGGVISGAGLGLTKLGGATLALTGANTYTGNTIISAGTLSASASASLGDPNNTLVFSGGTLLAAGAITSPSTRAVTLSGAGTINTNATTVSIAGVIGGSGGGLTKSGTGTLTLSAANTFTGGLTLSAGGLNINNATALGTGTFTIANGTTIDNTTAGAITESNNNAQSWTGNFTFTGTQPLNLGTGAVALTASRSVTVSASTLTVGGVISGATFVLTKAGAGALTLAGANAYTGGTTLSAGTLNINNATALGTGTFTISGGTIDNTSGGSITESNNNAQAWNGNFTFTGTQPLNLGTGAVTLSAARSVTVSASTLTVGGAISGAFGLTKAGAGALTLAGANAHTGGTTLSAGTLNVNNATALGTGTFTISGGTIDNTSGGSITESNNNAQAWNGNFTFTGSNDLNLGAGSVTMNASRTVTVAGGTLTAGGVISGAAFGLTKAGVGTLALTGANTYTGNTTISGGTLTANSTSALGGASNQLIFSGGTLQATGTISSPATRAVTLTSAGTIDTNGNSVSIAGVVSGANGLTKNGSGTLTLTGTNTYSGTTTLSAGTVNANSSAAIGNGSATNTLAFSGGTLQAGGTITSPSTRAVSVASGSATIDTNGNTVSIAGVISGSNGLSKNGSGTLTLTGTNTYSGSTNISAGTLNANSSTAIGDGSATNTLNISGGTLQAGGTITSPATRTVNPTNGTIDTNGNSVSIAGSVGGIFNLTKAGSGALTLSGNNASSGAITATAGTLTVNGSFGSTSISLNGGTLGGTGTTGTVTSTASGGTLAPGSPPPGILNTGNVNLSSGSPTFSVALNSTTAGSGYTQDNVTGTVNLTGATLSGSVGYTPVNGDSYTIIANDSTDAVTGTFAGLPEGSGVVLGGKSFQISYVGGDGNDVVLTAGGATQLAITSTPANATANVNFSVTVQSQDVYGNCIPVNSDTAISLATDGAGTLSGNTGTITAGTCSVTLNAVQDDQGETIHLTASRTSGDSVTTSAASSAIVVANGTFTTNTAVAINGTPTVDTASAITPGSYSPVTPTGTSYQWQLCDSSGNSCSNIGGATNTTYTPVPTDVGSTLRVVETVTHAGYNNGGSTSAASPVVIKANFTTNTAVSINPGTPTVDAVSSLTAGSYLPTPASSTYQWRLCDSLGSSCADIGGATSTTYTPVAGDVGHTLRVVETVSVAGYNDGSSTSAASPVVIKASFTTNTAVSINPGTPTVDALSTLTAGSYSPSPTSRAYQWELCDSSGNSCANIAGATSATYTPAPGDVGSTLRVVETASTAGYNDATTTSSASAVVINASFSLTSDVVINGQPTVGTTLTITNSVFSPTASSRTQQWELCDSGGASCSNIGGATGKTYTPVAGDVGSTLRIVQTVSRAGYNDGTSTSTATSAVVNGDFTTSTAVTIVGQPMVGSPSTITAGSYSPTPTSSSYQWELCDAAGNNCSDIPGATSNSYTPVATDAGSTLRIVETVSKAGYNDGGSTSGRADVDVGTITTNTAVAINGTPTVGTASTLTAGSYTPAPTGSSYQWRRCDSGGANCSNIGGATSNTYTPVAGDVGSTLRVVETVTKTAYANGSSTSAASPVVVKGSFSTNTAVSVNGTPTVGTASTLTPGSYTPSPTSSSYQWESCDSLGNSCANIGGATNATYTPVAGDVGSTLRVVETASKSGYNDGGSTSAASPTVVKGNFSRTRAVAINGTPVVGTATTITAGAYSPTPSSSSYQWELCDSSGNGCANIGGATSNTYVPISSQVGSTLRVVETVSAAGYNSGISTSSAAMVKGSFTTNVAVAINGTPSVGVKSTTTAGTYTPASTGRSYQWERCDSGGNNCVAIAGATYATYTPVKGDVGKTLRVVETVTKSLYVNGGSTSAASAPVALGIFVVQTKVAVFGYPKHGVISTITQGSYTPISPTSRTYQWKLCSGTSLSSCVNIAGATSKSYKPVHADVGKRLRVVETVSAPGYKNLSVTSYASTKVT
jgi:fibronectin-binding autotransporter adhesin